MEGKKQGKKTKTKLEQALDNKYKQTTEQTQTLINKQKQQQIQILKEAQKQVQDQIQQQTQLQTQTQSQTQTKSQTQTIAQLQQILNQIQTLIQMTPPQKITPILIKRDKFQQTTGYRPIMTDKKGHITAMNKYLKTRKEARQEGRNIVDRTPYNRFHIEEEIIKPSQLKYAKKLNNQHKFKKVGKFIKEKRYYRFDKPQERTGNFNIFPYVFGRQAS